MKQIRLKKRLIKTAVICMVILVLSGGALFCINEYAISVQEEHDRADTEANSTIAENATLKERIAKSSDSFSAYEKLTRYNKLEDFSLNRENASKLLNQLKLQYPLTHLDVQIMPVKELPGEIGKKKTGKVVFSEVRILFDASTDTAAMKFIYAVAAQFPGFVSYQSVKLSKKTELTGATFQEVEAERIPALVTGEMTFNWLGIRPLETTGAPK